MRTPTLFVLGVVALTGLAACNTDVTSSVTDSDSSINAYATSSVALTTSSSGIISFPSSAPAGVSSTPMTTNNGSWDGTLLKGKHIVTLQTSKGDITLELNADASPKTVTNFITHAKNGYYNNLTFHRVIPGFMIQGGDPKGTGTGGESIYGATFEDEIANAPELYQVGYKKGVVAMANRGANTNGSQFFIMDADYGLPPSYTIFGKVTAGQEVVSTIANVETGANDKPVTPVTFKVEVK